MLPYRASKQVKLANTQRHSNTLINREKSSEEESRFKERPREMSHHRARGTHVQTWRSRVVTRVLTGKPSPLPRSASRTMLLMPQSPLNTHTQTSDFLWGGSFYFLYPSLFVVVVSFSECLLFARCCAQSLTLILLYNLHGNPKSQTSTIQQLHFTDVGTEQSLLCRQQRRSRNSNPVVPEPNIITTTQFCKSLFRLP